MQEIELKFQVPASALAGVQVELQALAGKPLTPLTLRAAYFDTPDRRLAAARSALRVRQEGEDWVQTLKAGGSNTMVRVEDNQPTRAPEADQAIVAHLSLHAGGPAESALKQALGWQPERDPDGQATGLVQLYGTDITRWRVQVTVGRGTHHEGVVELALDLGHIHAGPHRLAVCELEIESISGHAMAVIDTGRDWVRRHGLWLDTQTKAHRGDRLARQGATAQAGVATTARPAKLGADPTWDQTWRSALESCIEHITANLSELATLAPAAPQAAAYEWRLGLRRLRALGQLWAGNPVPFPHHAMPQAAALAAQLGWWRDQEALSGIPAQLRAVGLPTPQPPHPPRPAGLPASIVELARSGAATALCLDLLAALMLAAPVADGQPEAAGAWIGQQLSTRAKRLVRQAQAFRKLDARGRHHLRQHLRELRDQAEVYATCWPAKLQARQTRHARALGKALAALGALQDVNVALTCYQREAQADAPDRPAYLAACEWLRDHQPRLARRASKRLKAWARVQTPW